MPKGCGVAVHTASVSSSVHVLSAPHSHPSAEGFHGEAELGHFLVAKSFASPQEKLSSENQWVVVSFGQTSVAFSELALHPPHSLHSYVLPVASHLPARYLFCFAHFATSSSRDGQSWHVMSVRPFGVHVPLEYWYSSAVNQCVSTGLHVVQALHSTLEHCPELMYLPLEHVLQGSRVGVCDGVRVGVRVGSCTTRDSLLLRR